LRGSEKQRKKMAQYTGYLVDVKIKRAKIVYMKNREILKKKRSKK